MIKKTDRHSGQNQQKTMITIVTITILAILFVVAALFLYIKYESSWKKTTIAVYTNTENGYEVVFEQVGEAFTFGPHNVKITLKDASGKKVDQIDATIFNDGATLSEYNATVHWEDSKVIITLHGCEQKDEVYEFFYEDT